jgi:hypothetical protein
LLLLLLDGDFSIVVEVAEGGLLVFSLADIKVEPFTYFLFI